MTRYVHTPAMVLAMFVLGGAISFMGGVTFAELGTRFPAAGGMYVYLRTAFGGMWAFLYGWALFLIIQTGSIAAVGVACAQYLSVFTGTPPEGQTWIAIAIIAFLTSVNAISTRAGANLQNLTTLMKCAGVALLIVLCLTSPKADYSHFRPLVADSFSIAFVLAIGNALVASLWAYDGWYQVGNIAGELEDPQRDVPRSLFLGLTVVCVLYILVTIGYQAVLSPEQIAGTKIVASDAAKAVAGDWGARMISLAVVISTFGCVNGMTISGPRVYYQMAREGVLPSSLGEAHPRFQTPFWPIVLQGLWSIVLVTSGSYDQLYNYVMFAGWVFYMLAGIALFILRRQDPDAKCYRCWGFPFTTAGFIAASLFLLVTTLVNYQRESLIGCAILAAGAVVYKWRIQSSATCSA